MNIKAKNRLNDFGNDKMLPLLLKLIIPSMLAQLVNVLYSIVDRIFISQMQNGELALAGVGLCGPIVTLITSFSFLLGLGGAPLLSMKLGENDKTSGERIIFNCFCALIVVSLLLTGLFFIFKNQMLYAFGASSDSFSYANEYMTVYMTGSIFALLSLGLNNFITAQGFSKTAMMTVIIGALANTALDPLFIFVFNLGAKGAAIATVIAQCLSCLWSVLFLVLSKKATVNLRFQKISFKILKKVMKLGLSPFIIIASDSIIIIVLNAILQKTGGALGDIYVAAATIVVSYMMLITMPLGGLTMACQPVISYNYGARNTKRIKSALLYALIMCLIFTTFMTLISQFLPTYFVKIFTESVEVSQVAIKGMRIYTAGVIVLSVQYIAVDQLVALGSTKIAITLSLLRKSGIIILTVLLPFAINGFAAFFAEPIIDVLSGIISGIIFLKVLPIITKNRENSQKSIEIE